jgi:hypothetical protein
MKICNHCNIEKDLSDFYKNKKKDVYLFRPECKACTLQKQKNYYVKNSEKIKKRTKNYEKINKEVVQRRKRLYEQKNIEKVNSWKNTWLEKNKEKRKEVCREYNKRKYRNKEFRLSSAVAASIRVSLKRAKISKKFNFLGFTIEELIIRLESTWTPGMSWENYGKGGWHIDHIRPLSSFDLSDEREFLSAWHLTNLQALWETDNLKKGSFFEGKKHKHGDTKKRSI